MKWLTEEGKELGEKHSVDPKKLTYWILGIGCLIWGALFVVSLLPGAESVTVPTRQSSEEAQAAIEEAASRYCLTRPEVIHSFNRAGYVDEEGMIIINPSYVGLPGEADPPRSEGLGLPVGVK